MEKRMSEMKLNFFTDISHEIRTPLTMITAPVDYLVADPETPEKVRKQLTLVSQNTYRLLRLVNQILDLRKVHHFKLSVKEIDFGAAVGDLCRNYDEVAAQRHIHYRFINQAPGEKIWMDPDCLEKIVNNLLSNAFKYTPDHRSIRVVIKPAEKQLLLEVSDEGQGISKDHQRNIFNQFVSFNEDKSKPSTGIGLFIVKDLVDKHGGKISLESEVSEGAVFTVSLLRGVQHFGKDTEFLLPDKALEPALEDEPSLRIFEHEESQERKRVILLAEDDADLRQFIGAVLNDEYSVIETKNGEEAWHKARKVLPDFIISDIMMPVLDGIELLQKLKDDYRTSHIPIILLTAKTAIESRIQGMTHGADDYITKPFNVPFFKARIQNLIEQRRRLQANQRSRFTDIFEPRPAADRPEYCGLSPVDEEFLKKSAQVVEKHIDDSEFMVDNLVSAIGMSRSVYFNKMKSLTGLAPIEFIRELKMKRAAELLATGDYLVKEVSYMLGISDTKYFGKCFKAKFGISPQDYKNS
jgi:DNA-binding response OmpR family regulator/two-component sensor histidine kinase